MGWGWRVRLCWVKSNVYTHTHAPATTTLRQQKTSENEKERNTKLQQQDINFSLFMFSLDLCTTLNSIKMVFFFISGSAHARIYKAKYYVTVHREGFAQISEKFSITNENRWVCDQAFIQKNIRSSKSVPEKCRAEIESHQAALFRAPSSMSEREKSDFSLKSLCGVGETEKASTMRKEKVSIRRTSAKFCLPFSRLFSIHQHNDSVKHLEIENEKRVSIGSSQFPLHFQC